jgi:hypothetical protein
VCVCVCVCLVVMCVYIDACGYTCMPVLTCLCLYTCVYPHLCVCVCVRVRVRRYHVEIVGVSNGHARASVFGVPEPHAHDFHVIVVRYVRTYIHTRTHGMGGCVC